MRKATKTLPSKKRGRAPKKSHTGSLKHVQTLKEELKEALEQQAATSEILRVIASSRTDLQPVLDTIAENASRLCNANDAQVRLIDGDTMRLATTRVFPVDDEVLRGVEVAPLSRGSVAGRAVVDRQPIHVHDLAAEVETEFPVARIFHDRTGTRTILATPLLREGIPLGAIVIRRTEVCPFSEKQIALVKTFADQAVIAIENVRLFQELEARNRDLTEALEQQTATSEILRVIASSPTDIQPVLDVVAESAARLCDADDALIGCVEGDRIKPVAHYGSVPVPLSHFPLSRGFPVGRAVIDQQTIHVHDVVAEIETEFPEIPFVHQLTGTRSILATPLLREGLPIGAIVIRRTEVHPFSDKQIELLKTFADQAVIAIENVRLFQELQTRNRELSEALEQQTATSEVLRIIATSPTDLQPVLNTLIANAVRLGGARQGHIREYDGELLRFVAHYNESPEQIAAIKSSPSRVRPESFTGRAIIERRPVHILDAQAEPRTQSLAIGTRTLLTVPLLREGMPIGTISIWRDVVEAFTDRQIQLVKTFADQAVIAIENVRLFQELQARNRDLTEALEQQTATGEILQVIASSPTDVQPVLDVVAERAARLCEATDAIIDRVDGDVLRRVAHYGPIPISRVRLGETRSISRLTTGGRAIIDREAIHIHDVSTPEVQAEFSENRFVGARTSLSTPLLREGVPIGVIIIRRSEFRPFTDKQIALLKTFADQAVIAIENVRLFQELQERTGELARSVEELKALGEVGQAVSSTLDIETVLSTIVGRAVQLSGTYAGIIYEYEEATQEFHLRASYRMERDLVEAYRATPIRLGQGATGGAAAAKAPVQVVDLLNEREHTATDTPHVGSAGI